MRRGGLGVYVHTYTGATTVNAGTLNIGNALAIGLIGSGGSATGGWVMGGGTLTLTTTGGVTQSCATGGTTLNADGSAVTPNNPAALRVLIEKGRGKGS